MPTAAGRWVALGAYPNKSLRSWASVVVNGTRIARFDIPGGTLVWCHVWNITRVIRCRTGAALGRRKRGAQAAAEEFKRACCQQLFQLLGVTSL